MWRIIECFIVLSLVIVFDTTVNEMLAFREIHSLTKYHEWSAVFDISWDSSPAELINVEVLLSNPCRFHGWLCILELLMQQKAL